MCYLKAFNCKLIKIENHIFRRDTNKSKLPSVLVLREWFPRVQFVTSFHILYICIRHLHFFHIFSSTLFDTLGLFSDKASHKKKSVRHLRPKNGGEGFLIVGINKSFLEESADVRTK